MKDWKYDLGHVSLGMSRVKSIELTEVISKVISRHREVGALFLPWKATLMMMVLRLGLVLRRLEVEGRRRSCCCFAQEVPWWCGSCI